jgi:membrane protease YdiL (CAAX protease family)
MLESILGLVALFSPLFLVFFIANAAERQRLEGRPYQGTAAVAYIMIVSLYGLAMLAAMAIWGASVLLTNSPDADALGPAGAIFQNLASGPLLVGGAVVAFVCSVLVIIRPVRAWFARLLPFDPENPVHTTALATSFLILVNLAFTLGFGLGNLTELTSAQKAAEAAADPNAFQSVFVTTWTQQILMALLAFVGVGWPVRRTLREALGRLGIVRLTRQDLGVGLLLALVMVPVVTLLGIFSQMTGIGYDPQSQSLTEELLGPLLGSPLGILTLGLAAALGEEPIFRGALQPRFGLLPTALLFALLHSNYGISFSTVVVFALGILLGVVRQRYNTSTAMVTHAAYNSLIGLLSFVAANLVQGQ